MKETVYIVLATFLNIVSHNPNTQECLNSPTKCLKYETSQARFYFETKDEAIMAENTLLKDTLYQSAHYAQVIKNVKLDSICGLSENQAKILIERKGESVGW